MKHHILTFLIFFFLTSCNKEEYYYKTPGEITGEKILELINEGFSDVSIANLFSVQIGKIRRFREGLYAK